eukprot:Opistho-1_new@32379
MSTSSTWIEYKTDAGIPYYYNVATKETVWVKPAEMGGPPPKAPLPTTPDGLYGNTGNVYGNAGAAAAAPAAGIYQSPRQSGTETYASLSHVKQQIAQTYQTPPGAQTYQSPASQTYQSPGYQSPGSQTYSTIPSNANYQSPGAGEQTYQSPGADQYQVPGKGSPSASPVPPMKTFPFGRKSIYGRGAAGATDGDPTRLTRSPSTDSTASYDSLSSSGKRGSVMGSSRITHGTIFNAIQVLVDDKLMRIAVRRTDSVRDFSQQVEAQFSVTYPTELPLSIQAFVDDQESVVPMSDLCGSIRAFSTLTVVRGDPNAAVAATTDGDVGEGEKRKLRVITVAGDVKTLMVDDTAPAKAIMSQIVGKLGIQRHQEFWLCTYRLDKSDMATNLKRRKAANRASMIQRKQSLGSIASPTTEPKEEKKKDDDEETPMEREVWLTPDDTLNAQGIRGNDVVYLRRRFFFLDDSAYLADPVALQLVYAQAREAILNMDHPELSQKDAISFAAMQCQVSMGDADRSLGEISDKVVSEVLPAEFQKVKKIDKLVAEEYNKLRGINTQNAMYHYVRKYATLPSYGITKFNALEPNPKKKKLDHVIVGVSAREGILRIDAKTNEIVDKYPLKFVNHFSCTPEAFKLYFGEKAEEVMVVQTSEGDAISRLLEGYAHLILKETSSR